MQKKITLTGPELIDVMVKHTTLDEFLDRDPHARPYTDQDMMTIVLINRDERAHFNLKAERRAAKRQGVEEPEQAEELAAELAEEEGS